MTTETIDAPATEPSPADATPRLRLRRVLRTLLIVVTTLALLVALATAATWAWGPGRSTDAWASRFGDPRVVLAAGVSLGSSPATVTRWSSEPTTYGLPGDTSMLAEAFGGPVAAVDDHSWATATGTVEFAQVADALADPTSSDLGPIFMGADRSQVLDAPVFTTKRAQEAEVRRILGALGWPTDVDLRSSTREGTAKASFQVVPHVPEASEPARPSTLAWPRFLFAGDGTLKMVTLPASRMVEPATAAPILTAEQALDDLRHHRSNAELYPVDVPNLVERALKGFADDVYEQSARPIASATLYGDTLGTRGQTHPAWAFADRDGVVVGWVLAAEGDSYPPDWS